jgi:hypothetical protein|nr:MAG TPA: hypothetical protein [Caudoviricetes sp.]
MASTTYEPLNPWRCSKSIIQTNSDRAGTDVCTGYHISVLGSMVRNSGQLPQPFWLGAARGGGSCSLSASVARA